jgi:hypothetical protein
MDWGLVRSEVMVAQNPWGAGLYWWSFRVGWGKVNWVEASVQSQGQTHSTQKAMGAHGHMQGASEVTGTNGHMRAR